MSSGRRPETMKPGYARFQRASAPRTGEAFAVASDEHARFQRASAPGRKQAGSVRTQEFSEELFMAWATTPRNDENGSQAGRLCHIL
jgi:hypothetical protein